MLVTGECIKPSSRQGHPVKLLPYNPAYQDDSVLCMEPHHGQGISLCVHGEQHLAFVLSLIFPIKLVVVMSASHSMPFVLSNYMYNELVFGILGTDRCILNYGLLLEVTLFSS
jgi:hypothetical protein